MTSEQFIGQITMFGGNYEPAGWKFCHGQLLSISQYVALYSTLGTVYGGDGRIIFVLPDIRRRVPLHVGGGPDLSEYTLGKKLGEEAAAKNGK